MPDYRLPDGSIPIPLSADTPDALAREAAALAAYLLERPRVTPDEVADMLLRTRGGRRHRALAMVRDREQLLTALDAIAAGRPNQAVITGDSAASARRIAYVFPGQGSQRPGMGLLYYRNSEVFRTTVRECDAKFQEQHGISPLAYLLHEEGEADEGVEIVQPALFMQMLGLAAMWRAVGVEPDVTIGHSQGEIAAAVVSGIISLADGIRVVTLRAQLVGSLERENDWTGQWAMAVLGVDRDECEALLARNSGWAELAVVNSAHVLAVSGERPAVSELVATLTAQGKFAKEIRVEYPAHTSFVSKFRENLEDTLRDTLDNQAFLPTEIECLGATLGEPVTPELPPAEYWYWNLRNRVRFDLAIAAGAARGIDIFLEIADHPALMLSMQETLSGVTPARDFRTIGTSRRTAEDLREFTRNLAQIAVLSTGFTWTALREDTAPRRLPLLDFPNSQTTPKKLWAPFDYRPEPAEITAAENAAFAAGYAEATARGQAAESASFAAGYAQAVADGAPAANLPLTANGPLAANRQSAANGLGAVNAHAAAGGQFAAHGQSAGIGTALHGSVTGANANSGAWTPSGAGAAVTTGSHSVPQGAESYTAAAESAFQPQRLAERWVRLEKRKLVPPRTLAVLDHTGRCADFAEAIEHAASRHGAAVVGADSGASFDTAVILLPPPGSEIRTAVPSSTAGQDRTATAAAVQASGLGADVATIVAETAAFVGDRAWLPELAGVRDVWLVTTGGEPVLAAELPDPVHAAAQAAFRCLASEHLGTAFRHVDLQAGQPLPAAAKALIGAVHTAGEPELAVREGKVYAKRLLLDETAEDQPLTAGDLAEVVIVGGTGKLGLDFCAEFVRAGAHRITLVGRSGGSAEALDRVRELSNSGTTIEIRRADVTDEAAVAALAAALPAPLTLLVHAAVDYDAAAADITPDTVVTAAESKLVAFDRLVRLLPLAPAARVLACSSLSATIGGRGHAVYAAINRMLDVAAIRYRHNGIGATSVQWGLWRAVGADNAEAIAKISGTGLLPMDPVAAVSTGFAAPGNRVVVAAEWFTLRTIFALFGLDPLFAEIPDAPVQAGVPAAATTATPVGTTAEIDTSAAAVIPAPTTDPVPDVADQVRDALRFVMGLDDDETIDGAMPLVALGLDSLQALDLRKRIEADLKRDLPVTAILGGASLDDVVSLLG
ncbi:SDR family NAD(P)-dependent oxidoreductase [Nocardia jejuensis]|uniref:SDR family NAD(P)-dependent oxidoreductase n=1 Tax=Nocardia jejuensis TaxID=328049 RepID=UPI00082A5CB8|nr:SDR family NAD(P)-dependent oxidoreductase [Nocardia jejuensis]